MESGQRCVIFGFKKKVMRMFLLCSIMGQPPFTFSPACSDGSCFEHGWVYWGSDLDTHTFSVAVNSNQLNVAKKCCEKCSEMPGCKYWSMRRDPNDAGEGPTATYECKLKTQGHGRIAAQAFISGKVSADTGADNNASNKPKGCSNGVTHSPPPNVTTTTATTMNSVPKVVYLFLVTTSLHEPHLAVWNQYFKTCRRLAGDNNNRYMSNSSSRSSGSSNTIHVVIHSQHPEVLNALTVARQLGLQPMNVDIIQAPVRGKMRYKWKMIEAEYLLYVRVTYIVFLLSFDLASPLGQQATSLEGWHSYEVCSSIVYILYACAGTCTSRTYSVTSVRTS